MCVILNIEPGASIPDDKLELACDINKDGYGLAYVDKQRLYVDHVVKVPNDPETIGKRLQKLQKHRVFLHLRHATVGAVNRANAHPFILTTKTIEGLDLGLMHNGTLSSWTPDKSSTDSDTLAFVNQYVRPAAVRTLAYHGTKVLDDPFFLRLLEREAGFNSTMLLFDNNGAYVEVNAKNWKKFEGFTASNEYSFDPTHYRCSKRQEAQKQWWENNMNSGSHSRAMASAQTFLDGLPWETQREVTEYLTETWESQMVTSAGGKSSDTHGRRNLVKYSQRLGYEIDKVADEITAAEWNENSMTAKDSFLFKMLNVERTPFVKQAGLNSLKDVGKLSIAQLEHLNEHYPQAMAQMYIDLIGECHRMEQELRNDASPVG